MGLLDELKGSRSQREWAADLGVRQRQVSRWLNGGRIGGRGIVQLLKRYPERHHELMRLVDERAHNPGRKPRTPINPAMDACA